MMMLCSKKYLYTSEESRMSNSTCAEFGENSLDVQIGLDSADFADDFCPTERAVHQLPPEDPLHLFIGALCELETCEGASHVFLRL